MSVGAAFFVVVLIFLAAITIQAAGAVEQRQRIDTVVNLLTNVSASNPNSQELANTLEAERYRESETNLFILNGLMSGKIVSMPSGSMNFALGFEYRDLFGGRNAESQ